ncbi:putative ferredoxin/ferredoxin--NADP reductase [Mycolicibacterium chitae]|uniref:ferredoxin--NADP(+) reductase n=1 Tax=Mycolicibacterium chitae TaxID=1792 RepID=A0A3S4VDN5_MYCCI|nr:FAD-dependent oxidoreductase [Mycolicibacterium chitae]MCV7105045.1 FAD-dependent oxidoreductase [Mycolicibacterium chitae]BBZ05675.1 putative ferredoxin/ferredoxin--NADP reductase [Mycolicibacterium chitae]VEG49286.1 4Fe-4S ferredoxin [Mycolicibacterium chitae]
MTYVVTQNCCNDATCVAVCPVDCIHPRPDEPAYHTAEMLYIDPQTCIDCGACAEVCPVDAIIPEDELTAETARYLDLNADYYARAPRGTAPQAPSAGEPPAGDEPAAAPLRVAIIGSGPAACYAAADLLARPGIEVEVTMLERLPFAGGLVRYGVAPDHAGTKRIARMFERTIRDDRVRLYLNVDVGRDMSVDDILAYHHAVVFATGADHDRRLDIPGEQLPGSHSAREFVAWYNGHSDHADRDFDLSGPRAVIVGNGNVALDVARILARGATALRHTDIADHALAALADSEIREVLVLGRRGPAAAACTTPELLGLADLTGVDVTVAERVPIGDDATVKEQVLAEYAQQEPTPGRNRITLRFHTTPVEILGTERVTAIRVRTADGGTEDIECRLVLRSIGYRGTPVADLPFDGARGTVANVDGRVVADRVRPGRYVAGWIKRGPTGVIGTNQACAQETVDALLADFRAGSLVHPDAYADAEQFEMFLRARRPEAMTAADWFAIDRHERIEGTRQGRPRVKLIDPQSVLSPTPA